MRYEIISVQHPSLASVGVARESMVFSPAILQVPDLAFGDTDPAAAVLATPTDAAEWPTKTLPLEEVYRLRIPNAVVHPPYGIITVKNYVIAETLGHVPFDRDGYSRNESTVSLPDTGIATMVAAGLHAMGGNYLNYFHWLTDIMTRLQIHPLTGQGFDGTILLPPLATQPIAAVASLLARAGHGVLSAGRRATLVQNLLFTPNLFNWGFAPNPHLTAFFDRLREHLGVEAEPREKIYISRRDSANRILLNEDAIIAVVRAHGYRVAELTGLNFVEQIRLFAGASHIVAPHGAGLANLVFCAPGVTVCELHMNTYLNWCFRRIAAMRGLRYGCAVGQAETETESGWVHNTRWTLPADRLETILAMF